MFKYNTGMLSSMLPWETIISNYKWKLMTGNVVNTSAVYGFTSAYLSFDAKWKNSSTSLQTFQQQNNLCIKLTHNHNLSCNFKCCEEKMGISYNNLHIITI
jgi:hypothetical protein